MAKLINKPPKNPALGPKNLTARVFLMPGALNEGDWSFIFEAFKQ